MKQRILLVEDEPHLQDAIKMNLEIDEYEVHAVGNGKEGLDVFRSERFDLVVLDVMLPEIDGFTLCQTIRLEDSETPILFLTAKDGGVDRVQGLKLGADDYLTKPFNLEELLLRVSNLLKRKQTSNTSSTTYSFGPNAVNFASYEATDKHGVKQTLSKKEVQLLKLLIDRKNEVVSREQILETVWGYDRYPSTRTIDNYILSFRKYFESDPRNPDYFHSVRGVGYKFKV